MAEYGVTEKGFILKRFDTIYKEISDEVSDGLEFDVTQNPQSYLNSVLLLPFCNIISTMWEVGQDIYYSHYPSTANGLNLDNAVQFGSVFRKGNKRSEYVIECTGIDGSIVTKGSLIASITNPVVQLQCVADTEITRNACNSLIIKPVIASSGNYIIRHNGVDYKYIASASDTLATIVEGLRGVFTASGFDVSISEGNLIISDSIKSESNKFELSSNLTTVSVTSLVHYYTVEYGDIACPNGSITTIVTNITGLQKVNNNLKYMAGQLREDDYALRQSYIKKGYNQSSNQIESVESYILQKCDDVESVRCYENNKDVVDSYGRPPHSIEVIVQGGSPEEIAPAILAKKTGGIATYGSTSVDVLGEYGDVVTINFNRPEKVFVWVKVTITTDGGNIPMDYDQLVKESIVGESKALTIGESFMSQLYIDNIYKEIGGTRYCKIEVGSSTDEGVRPTSFAEENVDVTERQVAMVSSDRIEVTIA